MHAPLVAKVKDWHPSYSAQATAQSVDDPCVEGGPVKPDWLSR